MKAETRPDFTPKQEQALSLLALGWGADEVARILYVSSNVIRGWLKDDSFAARLWEVMNQMNSQQAMKQNKKIS